MIEDEFWSTIYVLAKEFGWTAHYILYEVPVVWIRHLTDKIIERAQAEQDAAKGRKQIPKSETSPERIEQKNRLLAKARGLDYDEINSKNIFG